jgi:DNA repair protein SbcC/Rad50
MIIRKLKLHPFAGLTNHTIEFNNGLSVVCGPNEAGKSTTVRALYFVLFVKTNLTPSKEKSTISRFLPVTGGDTLNVTLEFTANNENYTLKKSWGGKKYSELVLPGGTVINDAEKVQEKLNELLEFNEATYQSVLFTYQSQLGKTLENLKEKNEAGNSLADLLRSAVMAQGGISAEKLISTLEEKKKEYFNNWEINAESPRNNKDIDNPHKKNIGIILECYYKKRALEEELKSTTQYEKQVDDAVQAIVASELKLNEKQIFINEHKDVVRDARQRNNLEIQYDKLKLEQQNLNSYYSKWPELELKISSLEIEGKKVKSEFETITGELINAEKRDSLKSVKEKYKSCSLLNDKIKELHKQIESLTKISEEDIETARNLELKIKKNTIRIEAQKLKLNICARQNLQLKLKPGMGQMQDITLKKDEIKEFEIKGGFDIEIPEIKFSVSSGNENIDELLNLVNKDRELLKGHFDKFKVEDFAGLQSLAANYISSVNELEKIKSNLKTLLDGISFEELEKKVKEAEEIPLARETAKLRDIKEELSSDLRFKQKQFSELKQEIDNLKEKYKSKEELLDLLVNIKKLLKETDEVLNNLLPVPANFDDASAFISFYEKSVEELNLLKEEFNRLRLDRAELDNHKPANSAEDLLAELEIATRDFERKKKEGLAILKIKSIAEKLIKSTETETYLPLQQKISKYFAKITEERYHEVLLDGTLPVRIENNNKGFELQQLSKGTLDALALATRLGMAEFYLENADGFLILDDPLVDLDEKRQKTAASAIQNFAENKQVIVFTCHGSHAKILKEDYYTMAVA